MPLPPGFKLDTDDTATAGIKLPSGFKLDTQPDNVIPIDRERQRNLTHYTSQGYPTREMMEESPYLESQNMHGSGGLPGREDLRAAWGDVRRGDLKKAAHEGFTGLSKAAGFAFGPATALTAPVATGVGMLGATAGKGGGKLGGALFGLSPEGSDLTGDAGELVGGALGGRFAENISGALKEFFTPKSGGRVDRTITAVRGAKPKTAEVEKQAPPRIVKPETYKARGERDPRDLGMFPGDKTPQPSPKGKLDAPRPQESQTGANVQSQAIAGVLKKAGISQHDALQLSDLEWKMIASTAGLKQVPGVEVFRDAVQSLK